MLPAMAQRLARKLEKHWRRAGALGVLSACVMTPYYVLRYYPERRRAKIATRARTEAALAFDRRYGTDTASVVAASALDLKGSTWMYARHYEGIDETRFHEILGQVNIDHREFVFIDIGSGKGKALLLASKYPFKQIVGVELADELDAIARKNIAIYHDPQQACTDLRSVSMDATLYEPPQIRACCCCTTRLRHRSWGRSWQASNAQSRRIRGRSPTRTHASPQEPLASARLMFSQAMPSRVRAAASDPASTGRKPIDSTTSRTVCLAVGIVSRDEAVGRDARDGGFAWREAKCGVEGLHDLAARQPALEFLRKRCRRTIRFGVGRFETSTTTLPAADFAISLAIAASACRRDGEDHEVRRVWPRRSTAAGVRGTLAASTACSGCAAAIVTLWPRARTSRPRALPTFPVPMIAMSMVESSVCALTSWLSSIRLCWRHNIEALLAGVKTRLLEAN